jgi:hypothetical protein
MNRKLICRLCKIHFKAVAADDQWTKSTKVSEGAASECLTMSFSAAQKQKRHIVSTIQKQLGSDPN